GGSDAAMVVLDPKTGEILVMVGSPDYNNAKIQGQVNMATAARQPGSSIKPYVYMTAFMQKGWNPTSIVLDTPLSARDGVTDWHPHNATGTFFGPLTLREGLAN